MRDLTTATIQLAGTRGLLVVPESVESVLSKLKAVEPFGLVYIDRIKGATSVEQQYVLRASDVRIVKARRPAAPWTRAMPEAGLP
jgi:hypothetical protein